MNAVIYARYSSHSQTEQSIEGQLRDNYAWAKQQGVTVVGEYIDRALTGTKDVRPDFQRMIEDATKRQFEMVIVWKLDIIDVFINSFLIHVLFKVTGLVRNPMQTRPVTPFYFSFFLPR